LTEPDCERPLMEPACERCFCEPAALSLFAAGLEGSCFCGAFAGRDGSVGTPRTTGAFCTTRPADAGSRLCSHPPRPCDATHVDGISPASVSSELPARLIERCSEGIEDQGAEEAFIGLRENRHVSFGSRLPGERLSFQTPETWNRAKGEISQARCTRVRQSQSAQLLPSPASLGASRSQCEHSLVGGTSTVSKL